ncbi:MAG TPA: Fic family protein [Rhodothermales bacterium]|nr:Fic family protein [Rhodothermales bacterium]
MPQKPPRDWRNAFYSKSIELLKSLHNQVKENGPAPGGKYRHWDTLRHIEPPEGLTSEQWWSTLKMARQSHYRTISLLLDKQGSPFQYALVDPVLERLHRIDRDASGHIALPEQATSPEMRDRHIVNSLIEEAITSSQLEGAATTRAVAKEMIRTGRKPVDKSEQMILNNFRAMQFIRAHTDERLTPDFVFQIHRIVTEKTLAPDQPALRQPQDGIGVYSDTGLLLHKPPSAQEIEERLVRMCTFANEAETGIFLHPVLKAIILHFWLAYDHPFTDGNGRTARALFYWSMLREGFWLAEYLSISRILKKAPARYGRSFLYTETDDNDLTYFILAQLRVIEQAIDALKHYLRRKAEELQSTKALLRPSENLNHRQTALLSHALRHPGQIYTVESHQTSHAVAYDTARTDLLDLETKGFLTKEKRSKKYIFRAPTDLADRLREES